MLSLGPFLSLIIYGIDIIGPFFLPVSQIAVNIISLHILLWQCNSLVLFWIKKICSYSCLFFHSGELQNIFVNFLNPWEFHQNYIKVIRYFGKDICIIIFTTQIMICLFIFSNTFAFLSNYCSIYIYYLILHSLTHSLLIQRVHFFLMFLRFFKLQCG